MDIYRKNKLRIDKIKHMKKVLDEIDQIIEKQLHKNESYLKYLNCLMTNSTIYYQTITQNLAPIIEKV